VLFLHLTDRIVVSHPLHNSYYVHLLWLPNLSVCLSVCLLALDSKAAVFFI
jgi:hypothetical protein